jgi:serine/threonine protein kinase
MIRAPMTPRDHRAVEDALGLNGQRLLDRYEVDMPIAQGGMAIIYRGHDTRLLRPVCIKVFHRLRPGQAAYRAAYEHFIQEAFTLSQFNHPNTLRIYDFGYLEGDVAAPFQISEMLEGGTLSRLVRRHGPLTPTEAREILEPVAGALAEAHARGIVHRDIKPSNILFGLAGARRVVKLCDFGIAKVSESPDDWPNRAEDTFASAGQPLRLYSPGWASPEQIRGEKIGPASDVYALGLLTAFVLTGRPVFPVSRDAPADERSDDADDQRVARTIAAAGLPRPLAGLIERACKARVDDRIGSADAFAAELGTAVRTTSAPPAEEETEPVRRLPLRAPPTVDDLPVVPEGTPVPILTATPSAPTVAASAQALAVASTVAAPGPAPAAHARPLTIDPGGDEEVLVAGRRLRMIGLAGHEQIDLGGDATAVRSPARFRVTLMPSGRPAPRVNVKGLNCFVARIGARPTTAVDVEGDMDVELIAPDRRRLDGVRCTIGRPGDGGWLYDLGTVTLAVPAAGAVLLDVGPGRELALVHRGAPRAARGRRR